MQRSTGFDAVARHDARILVLGSLPGRRSIKQQQYYAHPRNAFWPIMQALYEIRGNYAERLGQLVDNRIALWDVLQSSVRPGSLDGSIATSSARANDFSALFRVCPDIRLIAFNGQKAGQLFRKLVPPVPDPAVIEQVCLPSTSPAYAAMPFSVKLAQWREALAPANG
ncbi:MAG: DNA-deoxyinosine glycosylase [Woeseiaceae bacterium]|nr:DNA-deoxyinosine glycosylase [Woeseiaceae bacterium]